MLDRFVSPCGDILLGAYDEHLCIADWRLAACHEADKGRNRRLMEKMRATLDASLEYGTTGVTERAKVQLDEYFRGIRCEFDIPLLLVGTEFQCKVWRTLDTIGYGETISYSEEAFRVGNPRAIRAVGTANGANPISIVVPCHRVIAGDGGLGGYGGGIDIKRFLLRLEKKK